MYELVAVVHRPECCGHVAAPAPTRYVDRSVVYYVGVGDRIKIGRTKRSNLTSRLSGLRAEVLLAIEPGDSTTELRRHEQFAHWRLDGEWFSPGADLLDFIESIAGREELPPLPRRVLDGRGNRRGRTRRGVA